MVLEPLAADAGIRLHSHDRISQSLAKVLQTAMAKHVPRTVVAEPALDDTTEVASNEAVIVSVASPAQDHRFSASGQDDSEECTTVTKDGCNTEEVPQTVVSEPALDDTTEAASDEAVKTTVSVASPAQDHPFSAPGQDDSEECTTVTKDGCNTEEVPQTVVAEPALDDTTEAASNEAVKTTVSVASPAQDHCLSAPVQDDSEECTTMTEDGCNIEGAPRTVVAKPAVKTIIAVASPALVAESPFDDTAEEADLILRSSNGVHFYVNQTILTVASPVFKDMISNAKLSVDHRPCVPLEADSRELHQLLSWCDPRGLYSITLEAMQMALRLADKYVMKAVIRRIESILESLDNLVKAECLRVYALSIRHHFPNLIQKAARYSLMIPVHKFPIVPEFDNVTGGAVQKLYAFRLACGKAAESYIETWSWIDDNYLQVVGEGIQHFCSSESPTPSGAKFLVLRKRFATYIAKIKILVSERPLAAVIFDQSSYCDALIVMASCEGCRPHVPTFTSLVSQIAEGIDKVTKEIKVIPFFSSVGRKPMPVKLDL